MHQAAIIVLLLVTGFVAGHNFARLTQPPPLPVVINRIDAFQHQIQNLEQAVSRVCSP